MGRPFFRSSTYSQVHFPGLNFPACSARYVSRAAAAAAKPRSGSWERACERRSRHARTDPGPGGPRIRVARCVAACDRLPRSSGTLEAAASPRAHPVPSRPCGQRAGSAARGPWPAASSRAEAAAVTPPPGRGCEAGRVSPHRARAPGVGGSAALGDGPAAGAPRLLGPGAVRGPAGEGKRPRRGGGRGAAGDMEGVLYKWTNYLSGE